MNALALIRRFAIILVVAGALVVPHGARAASLPKKIFRGITYGLSPSIGTVQNGPFADQNIFRQHFIRNYVGDGMGYEFTRTFGTDSFGNGNTFDAGSVNLSLQGAMHNRFEINRRFIPELNIQSDTNGQQMNYNMRLFLGAESVQFQGAFAGNLTGTINALGFYNLQVSGTNTGTRRADGMLLTDNQITDFDIGPVNVVGNVFFDLASNFIQAGGATLGGLLTNVPSAASGKTRIDDPAGTSAADAQSATEAEMQQAFAQSLVQSLFAAMFQDLNSSDQSNVLLLGQQLGLIPSNSAKTANNAKVAPEPSTLALLAAPVLLLLTRRRSFRLTGGHVRSTAR